MHTRLGDRGGHVSIHTPTKGVTVCLPIFQSVLLGFNPHTHEGCDIQARWVRAQRAVSIHTPTKGVTYRLRKQGCIIYVSIHTPTKGVTFALRCKHKQSDCFNPHTHEGCDSVIEGPSVRFTVSIHTPTKGVTLNRLHCHCLHLVSIHTPTKGVTCPGRHIP